MSIPDRELTPRQREFQRRVDELLAEYADSAGPNFDGGEESQPMNQPVAISWLLIADWDDANDSDSDGALVVMTSARCRLSTKVGLIEIARNMAAAE